MTACIRGTALRRSLFIDRQRFTQEERTPAYPELPLSPGENPGYGGTKMKRLSLVAFLTALLLPATVLASVTLGGLAYSVQGVHTASTVGPEGIEQHANGEFIVLRLKVANVGHDPATINGSDFHLRRGGTMFDSASQSMMMDGAFFFSTINPGTSHSGTILFDVPAHTNPSQYELQVFGNGGSDPTYIRL